MEKFMQTDLDIEYIVNRYTDALLRFCAAKIKQEADRYDVLQEVFVAFLKSNKGRKDEAYIKNWLYKVASYKIDDFLRKRYKITKNEMPEIFSMDAPYTHESLSFEDEIRRLPEKQGQAIYLFYYEGYSTDEISRILNVKPSTVRNNLDKARENLERIFSESKN